MSSARRHFSRCRWSSGIAHRCRLRRTSSAWSGVPALRSSQDSGRNNRQSSAADAQSVTACTLTPTWQFAVLPNAPQYIRATPGEETPSLGNPVSSTANASGSTKSRAHTANRRRTAVWSQVEVVTNCCNCW